MPATAIDEAIAALAAEPLRNLGLLKPLLAYPRHVRAHRVAADQGTAIMVTLDAAASAYDRHAYPGAALAAFIESDHPALTSALLDAVPHGAGVVFKLSRDVDAVAVGARFAITRRTAFLPFTTEGGGERAPDTVVTQEPGDDAYRLFAMRDHAREWLEPLRISGHAGMASTKSAAPATTAATAPPF